MLGVELMRGGGGTGGPAAEVKQGLKPAPPTLFSVGIIANKSIPDEVPEFELASPEPKGSMDGVERRVIVYNDQQTLSHVLV